MAAHCAVVAGAVVWMAETFGGLARDPRTTARLTLAVAVAAVVEAAAVAGANARAFDTIEDEREKEVAAAVFGNWPAASNKSTRPQRRQCGLRIQEKREVHDGLWVLCRLWEVGGSGGISRGGSATRETTTKRGNGKQKTETESSASRAGGRPEYKYAPGRFYFYS